MPFADIWSRADVWHKTDQTADSVGFYHLSLHLHHPCFTAVLYIRHSKHTNDAHNKQDQYDGNHLKQRSLMWITSTSVLGHFTSVLFKGPKWPRTELTKDRIALTTLALGTDLSIICSYRTTSDDWWHSRVYSLRPRRKKCRVSTF